MPPVVYPPLDNPDRALIHLVSSHGRPAADVAADLADTDLEILRIEHDHSDHAWPCDHVHADGHHDRLPPWVRQMAEVTTP